MNIKICLNPECGEEFQAKPKQKYCDKCTHTMKLKKISEWKAKNRERVRGYRTASYYLDPYDPSKKVVSKLNEKLKYAHVNFTTYAELQKADTIKMFGRVVI
ncbi:MAG TPA: hypothetical protein VFD03_06140 [Clostridia bacterium]|nr:hypothetical protein [Clostridia bacterium]